MRVAEPPQAPHGTNAPPGGETRGAPLRFPGRDALFLLVLSTMMLPPQVTMIPQFILFTIPGWIDSLKPLIVPSFFGGGAFFIFLLRQFFLTIPVELEEAARLDGCSTFGVFRHVILPNSKPALATVALFSFIATWNEFLFAVVLTGIETKTMMVLVTTFTSGGTDTFYGEASASVVLGVLPAFIVAFLLQRYLVKGLALGGTKG